MRRRCLLLADARLVLAASLLALPLLADAPEPLLTSAAASRIVPMPMRQLETAEVACDSETASNFWGGLLSCVASVISNFGVNIQKYAHMINDRKPKHMRKHYMKMGVW